MANPTNTEDYEFAFYFTVKGVKMSGPADPDTWYPNIQYGLRGADAEPPAAIRQAYLEANPMDPTVAQCGILYTPPVTWADIGPEDIDGLPGSVDDFTFGVFFEALDDSAGHELLQLGLVGDGEYGAELALFALPMYEAQASSPASPLQNVTLAYTTRITWSTWAMSE